MKLVIVTGPMASGKSTISKMIRNEHNAVNIDADLVVHELYKPGTETTKKIAEHFGEEVVDENGVNRAALTKTLKGEWDWKDLETIVHPDVRKEIYRQVEEQRNSGIDTCTLELPALPRNVSWFDDADLVVICDAPRKTLIARAGERGLNEEQAIKRLDRQLSSNELKAAAEKKGEIVDTAGDTDQALAQIKNLLS